MAMIKYHYILIDYGVIQKKIQGDHTDGVLIKDKKKSELTKTWNYKWKITLVTIRTDSFSSL